MRESTSILSKALREEALLTAVYKAFDAWMYRWRLLFWVSGGDDMLSSLRRIHVCLGSLIHVRMQEAVRVYEYAFHV